MQQSFMLNFFAFLFILSCAYGDGLPDIIDLCKAVDCGQGTCNKTTDFPFFKCECFSGWTDFKIMNVSLIPTCILPDCASNLNCALPKLPPLVLPTNFSDPCNFVLCGNGTCAPKSGGVGHICNCAPDSYNVFNATDLPCFQECYVGADCNDVPLGPPVRAPTPSGTSSTGSPSGGGSSSKQWIEALAYMVFLISLQFVV